MSYSIEFYRKALRYIQKLDKPTRKRISKEIKLLSEDPFHPGLDIRRLQGTINEYRLRVGSYRVVYSVENEILYIYIIKIGPRGDVYKG